jgi:TM2 domain-containing membrane protein YozV
MRRGCLAVLLLMALSAPAQFRDSVAAGSVTSPRGRPAVAVALSMLMPGAGQLYNGEQGKALLHFSLFAGAVTWVAVRDIGPTNADIKPLDWLSVIAVGTTYVWAAIDAGTSAGKTPEELSHPPDEALRHLSLRTVALRGSTGLSLSYCF